MTRWAKHWDSHPKKVGETEYLKQVGKTAGGVPISERQYKLIISEIFHHLNICEDDVVLDLCCGNGLITKEFAKECKQVVGVDFSQPLLEIASRDHRPENVSYLYMNVLNFDRSTFNDQLSSSAFTKILMYGALQYFKQQDLNKILYNILQLSVEECIMFFGSVPDRKRIWHFYNTPKRRFTYLFRKFSGSEAIGTWWDMGFVERICTQLDLQCEFYTQNYELHTAHYRFDVKIF